MKKSKHFGKGQVSPPFKTLKRESRVNSLVENSFCPKHFVMINKIHKEKPGVTTFPTKQPAVLEWGLESEVQSSEKRR